MAADLDGFLDKVGALDPIFDITHGRIILTGKSGVKYVGLFGLTAGNCGGQKILDRLEISAGEVWDDGFTAMLVYTDGGTQTLAPGIHSFPELAARLDGAQCAGIIAGYFVCRATVF